MKVTKSKIKKAVEGTVLKWAYIYKGLKRDKGIKDCSLCKLFFRCGYCVDCLIYKKTGKSMCNDTPYDKWIEHYENEHIGLERKVHCPECRKLAKKQFNFVLNLLKEV